MPKEHEPNLQHPSTILYVEFTQSPIDPLIGLSANASYDRDEVPPTGARKSFALRVCISPWVGIQISEKPRNYSVFHNIPHDLVHMCIFLLDTKYHFVAFNTSTHPHRLVGF